MNRERAVFTKHLFRSGCRCVTKLYYKADAATYPERDEEVPFIMHVRHNKRQLKGLMRALYPDAIAIEQNGFEKASQQTARNLQQNHAVLFEASFLVDGLFAKVPVLEKDGKKATVFHLQTKAFDPGRHSITDANGSIHSKWKDYLRDFAFQLYVMKRCRPEWKLEPWLALPDKTAEARIDRMDQLVSRGDPVKKEAVSNLLTFVPVMDHINRIWQGSEPLFEHREHPLYGKSFEESVKTMARWYAGGEKVFSGVGKKCSNCEFRVELESLGGGEKSGFRECWEGVLPESIHKDHVFDLIGAGNRPLIEHEVYLQENVTIDEQLTPERIMQLNGNITDRHRRALQIAKAKGMEIPTEIVRPGLLEELESWEFPLHFLDFEAGSFAVPFRAGRRPYQLVVFQFSCHTLHSDGSLSHHDWLHPGDQSYPNVHFIQALKEVPGILDGTIVQYSGFERSALKKIHRELDRESEGDLQSLKKWIELITRRDDSSGSQAPYLADLGRMVKSYYYNIRMEDSLSIKDVLRSVMEVSPVLKDRFSRPYRGSNFDEIVWWQRQKGRVRSPYEILRERREAAIGRGTEAMVAYARLRSGGDEEIDPDELRSGLLSYCELDTLAMVMIYLHWKEILNV